MKLVRSLITSLEPFQLHHFFSHGLWETWEGEAIWVNVIPLLRLLDTHCGEYNVVTAKQEVSIDVTLDWGTETSATLHQEVGPSGQGRSTDCGKHQRDETSLLPLQKARDTWEALSREDRAMRHNKSTPIEVAGNTHSAERIVQSSCLDPEHLDGTDRVPFTSKTPGTWQMFKMPGGESWN